MKALTEKQKNILDFIEDFQDRERMAPTVYEIADFFKIKTSTVFAHLKALQRKNQLARSGKARSISLQRSTRKLKHMSFALPIPLLGRINAGLPTESLEYKEGDVLISANLISKNDIDKIFALKVHGESMRDLGILDNDIDKIFALKVHGESMRDLGILDGDIVIVKQQENVHSGDIVVALVQDETTVKSFFPLKGGKIELRPANKEFASQIHPAENVKIQGKVIALQRQY